MTFNELVGKIAQRASYLSDLKKDQLRMCHPDVTETAGELIKLCKMQKLTRGQIIEAVLVEEFSEEFDREIEE